MLKNEATVKRPRGRPRKNPKTEEKVEELGNWPCIYCGGPTKIRKTCPTVRVETSPPIYVKVRYRYCKICGRRRTTKETAHEDNFGD